jgi:hypothetical protein
MSEQATVAPLAPSVGFRPKLCAPALPTTNGGINSCKALLVDEGGALRGPAPCLV